MPSDDEGVIAAPEQEQGMQDKLMAAWDCLQVLFLTVMSIFFGFGALSTVSKHL